MKQISCNFCGADDTQPVQILRDIWLNMPGKYQLVRCRQCGLEFLNPQPEWDDLKAYYSPDYFAFMGAIQKRHGGPVEWARNFGVRRRCRAILRHKSNGRLRHMRGYPGWQVQGVEPVEMAAEAARKVHGLEVFTGTLLEACYPDDTFDVVTFWDVLEHVPDPKANLQESLRILKPGGWLALKVPNPAGYQAKLFGPAWVGYEAPHHLYGYPSKVMVKELGILGFDLVESVGMGTDYFTLYTSLGGWLETHGQQVLGRFFRKIAKNPVLRALSYPEMALIGQLGLRASLVYFARKPND
jgi:SAM-dependent methyltransferase